MRKMAGKVMMRLTADDCISFDCARQGRLINTPSVTSKETVFALAGLTAVRMLAGRNQLGECVTTI